ncbi:hypothetical protein CEUSTIGMA_g6177.t1 [Chlamydomonas eustigma]|uniref:Uncharacterized protein n=1 Tax=Chlamydomonas eustigma TaxID=1157962 RepID=A0A250X7K4_9CHLO|nr:hypothetical protein CEUSTIGMA_g6177.t1 [Chlamydomonas eustigma]|eukprot:GAX78740.1 hypothetical protein CEUSTIGMA_g6177.t1 [Chlamydomonas eustigma]
MDSMERNHGSLNSPATSTAVNMFRRTVTAVKGRFSRSGASLDHPGGVNSRSQSSGVGTPVSSPKERAAGRLFKKPLVPPWKKSSNHHVSTPEPTTAVEGAAARSNQSLSKSAQRGPSSKHQARVPKSVVFG